MANPLLSDRDVAFQLYEVHGALELCSLPYFADHGRETFDPFLASARKLAREVLFPAYRPMDQEPPKLVDGRVRVHPAMREIWPRLVELGLTCATRPAEVGGQQMPAIVAEMGAGYLMAGNVAAMGYVGLTAGAGHLIEEFGSEWLRETFLPRMYGGVWSGTMALTEPQAGSSLADVRTRARPTPGGHYLLDGNKVFISGGDQDFTENVVHLALARIEGAPAGVKGISLFAVPRLRPGPDGALVDNDCHSAGVFHKLGWRGLPSIALNFGERGDCRGWLVGTPHQGLAHMFQMMNSARLMVGMNGVTTAYVAYQEALEYARTRTQGRPLSSRDPRSPPVPIVQHADVRRMLLRQKAIVEGAFSLLAACARLSDLADHAESEAHRSRCAQLLDLLTPVAKTFPAEKGFESNVLAVQVHGGYGYTSEYLPEAWMRDQKLNSLHEGTSGIQALDLLGRKVLGTGGASLRALAEQVMADCQRPGADPEQSAQLARALATIGETTMHLGTLGDRDAMMRNSSDYMELFSIAVIAWQWLLQAAAAREGLRRDPASSDFYKGKLAAARYWFATEVPRIDQLCALVRSPDDSYSSMRPEWF
jgi:alkylation response protein AidB-like acyl-CoA dehydrogenase